MNLELQLLINIIVYTCSLLPIALSIYVVYSSSTLINFSIAAFYAIGPYLLFYFYQSIHLNIISSVILSLTLLIMIAVVTDLLIFRQLRKNRASFVIIVLASLGVYIIFQNLISMIFGDDTKSIRTWPVVEGNEILGARITDVQIIIVAGSLLLVLLVAGFLSLAKTGKAMRAVANNKELADISGINSDKIILISFAIGSALAGIAGILVALDVDMTPTMGMNALMMGVVAMIVGGVGSIRGIALGALLLASAQNLGVWYISSQWQDAIAFAILLIFLLFKPEGFFGKKVKKAEI